MRRLLKRTPLGVGFWSLSDQGAVSLGNFLTQMLLARSLSWSDYGVFALLYGVLYFLITSLGSLVTYPLSVKGASADPRGLRGLAGVSLLFDMGLLIPEGLVVLCAVAVLHRVDLFPWAFLALLFWQFQETLRRVLMARLGHRDAVWGDGLSYLGQTALITVLIRTSALSLKATFVAIAVTSAAAALVQTIQVRPRVIGLKETREAAGEYWSLGKWAFSTIAANGLTQQVFPWALGLLFGTPDAGSFQAIVNPLKVFNPVIVGTQNLVVPAAAKMQQEGGVRAAARSGMTYAAVGALVFLPYIAVLLMWPHAVLALLYGSRSPYTHLDLVLRICVVAYAFGYWAEIGTSLLNGLGLPKTGFMAQLASTIAALALGLPLTVEWGLTGAMVALGVCALAKAGVALFAIRSESRRDGAEALVHGIAS